MKPVFSPLDSLRMKLKLLRGAVVMGYLWVLEDTPLQNERLESKNHPIETENLSP